jgi:hypothetical protein
MTLHATIDTWHRNKGRKLTVSMLRTGCVGKNRMRWLLGYWNSFGYVLRSFIASRCNNVPQCALNILRHADLAVRVPGLKRCTGFCSVTPGNCTYKFIIIGSTIQNKTVFEVHTLSLIFKILVVSICTTCFNITCTKLCIPPTECICVFRMVLTINSDCFPKQH